MIDFVSSDQATWRYLTEPGDGNGSFTRFLDSLGIRLTTGLSLRRMVQLGWVAPRLRVHIPTEFLSGWTNYPIRDVEGEIPAEHAWARAAYAVDNDPRPAYLQPNEPLHPRWYEHPLDVRTEAEIDALWRHAAMPQDLEHPPELFEHPRGIKTLPYIDWYAYWQAYEIRELQQAIILFEGPANTPEARHNLQRALDRFNLYQDHSTNWITATKRRWQAFAPIFDWLGRYRALVGNWAYHRLPDDTLTATAKALAAEHSLAPDRLRDGIRNHLLTLWQDWSWGSLRDHIPVAMKELLREDIHRAFQLLSIVADTPIDLYGEFFDPPHRQPLPWARPAEVLPFESIAAKRDLPATAPHYLTEINALLPVSHQLTTAVLEANMDKWWTANPAFPRFCINLKRLHQHYSAEPSTRVLLEERTPVDYLLLTAMSAERVLLHQFLRGRRRRAPSFEKLLTKAGARITTALCLPPVTRDLKKLLPKTQLFMLTKTPSNPFATATGLPRKTLRDQLIAAFSNLAVMRHYAAHHDVLDDQLIGDAWGREPLAALLIVTLLTLQTT